MDGWMDERADRYRARSGAVFLVRAGGALIRDVMECPSHHNRQAAAANDGGQGLELGLGQYNLYNGGAL